jgi:hypothetical protein
VGFDGGYDLYYKGFKIDVKTMGRTVAVKSNFVNNFVSLQLKFDCDVYIFCSLNKKNNILTICGWVTKEELLDRSKYYEKGTVRVRSNNSQLILQEAIYEIENHKLNKIEDLI